MVRFNPSHLQLNVHMGARRLGIKKLTTTYCHFPSCFWVQTQFCWKLGIMWPCARKAALQFISDMLHLQLQWQHQCIVNLQGPLAVLGFRAFQLCSRSSRAIMAPVLWALMQTTIQASICTTGQLHTYFRLLLAGPLNCLASCLASWLQSSRWQLC